MNLKKIFLSWWGTWPLTSIFYLYVYSFLYIDSFIAGKIFIFMFIFSFMLVCIDSFIDSFIADETMENLRRKRWGDEEMLEEKLEKLTAQPSFKQFKIFNKSLVAVERAKVELTFNRPIHVGFAILNLSETLMYDFHHNYIKRKFSTRRCYLLIQTPSRIKFKRISCTKTFMLISICSIFLIMRKKVHSMMMKTKQVIGKMKDDGHFSFFQILRNLPIIFNYFIRNFCNIF